VALLLQKRLLQKRLWQRRWRQGSPAANSGGPGGPTGPLDTPSRTLFDPPQIGNAL
jgi:hypothetical protein